MSKARDIASAAPAPSTVSATEIGYLDGVTSAIQTQLDAKTAKSTLTTTGDIYYASAANTPARLGIGTASQILAVNSGATAPEWVAAPSSGGMTLINAGGTTLTGASVTISSIPATYNNLMVVVRNFRPVNDNITLRMRINEDAAANRHRTVDVTEAFGATFNETSIKISSTTDNGATANNLSVTTLYDYANTSTFKICQTHASIMHNATTPSTQFNMYMIHGYYNQTGAISSLVFLPETGDFTSGTVFVYGVK
jgi:hypothetical protein